MRTNAEACIDVAWSVCLSVRVFVTRRAWAVLKRRTSMCRLGWQEEPCIGPVENGRHLANTIKLRVLGGDAVCCYHYYYNLLLWPRPQMWNALIYFLFVCMYTAVSVPVFLSPYSLTIRSSAASADAEIARHASRWMRKCKNSTFSIPPPGLIR